jgi:uncharacterized coiled-coil protein SlyX
MSRLLITAASLALGLILGGVSTGAIRERQISFLFRDLSDKDRRISRLEERSANYLKQIRAQEQVIKAQARKLSRTETALTTVRKQLRARPKRRTGLQALLGPPPVPQIDFDSELRKLRDAASQPRSQSHSGELTVAFDDEFFIAELDDGRRVQMNAKTFCFGFFEGDRISLLYNLVEATMVKSGASCKLWVEEVR